MTPLNCNAVKRLESQLLSCIYLVPERTAALVSMRVAAGGKGGPSHVAIVIPRGNLLDLREPLCLAGIALAGLFCLSFSANSFAKDDEWPRCRGAKADPQDSVVAADPPKVLSPGQVSAEFTCSWACSAVAKCRLCEPKTPSSDQRTSPSSQDHLAAQLTLRSLYVFALGIPFPSSGDRRQQCRCTRPSSGKAGVSPAFFSERTFLVSSLKDLFGVNAAHIIALKLNTALQLDGLRPFDLIPNCPMRPSAAVRRRCCASDPWRASS